MSRYASLPPRCFATRSGTATSEHALCLTNYHRALNKRKSKDTKILEGDSPTGTQMLYVTAFTAATEAAENRIKVYLLYKVLLLLIRDGGLGGGEAGDGDAERGATDVIEAGLLRTRAIHR
jgi:hypothetical protein